MQRRGSDIDSNNSFLSMLHLFGDSCSRINDPRKPIRKVILIFLPVFSKTIISKQFQKLPVCLNILPNNSFKADLSKVAYAHSFHHFKEHCGLIERCIEKFRKLVV